MQLVHQHKVLSLAQPQVMGILNVTPDSFSDGGRFAQLNAAVEQALAMQQAGASIIDIGGESTRPGATPVSLQDELNRVIPVIEAIRKHSDVWISIDTMKAEVMAQAVAAGADIVNDVSGLRDPQALATVAARQVPVCIMHMQGEPQHMQANPQYDDVVAQVYAYLEARIELAEQAGILRSQIIVDPGFGFGKTLAHNYQLLANLKQFQSLHCPVLAGMSRKSMIGNLLNKPVEQRLAGSLACALLAAQQQAQIIRVHDVAETYDVLAVLRETAQHQAH